MVNYVKDAFQFEAFKDFAADIAEADEVDSSKFVELLKEWELVEAKELYRLSLGRISTIDELDRHIREDSKEVPALHKFFKKFPWLLDPRIIEFRNEVSYSNLLKEKYPDEELEEPNRRIDFVCTSVSNSIELKRPNHAISANDIDQAADYRSFLERQVGSAPESTSRVVAYVVGGKPSGERLAQSKIETYKTSGEVYVKTYIELLENARKYHQEFIDKYKKLEGIRAAK